MHSEADIRKDAIQAGVFLAGEGIFMNSRDVAQFVTQANTTTIGNGTVFGTWHGSILGATVNNSVEMAFLLITLPSNKYDLKKPILVTVRQEDDSEWVATFADAELSRSGDSRKEAIDWLQSSIVELYELFRREKKLGPLPNAQLRALRRYIVEKPNPKT